MNIYSADFECTVEMMDFEHTNKIVVTWAGLQSCETMKQQVFKTRYDERKNKWFNALDSFMNKVSQLKDGSIVIFHNLKGYDHAPIYYWLYHNNMSMIGQPNDFRVNFGDEKNKRVIRFFDSLNLLQNSIAGLAKMIGLSKGGNNNIETPLVSSFTKDTTTIRVENAFTKDYKYYTFDMSIDKAFKVFHWDEYAREDINVLAHSINHFKIDLLLHNKIHTYSNWAWQTVQLADFNKPDPEFNWLHGLNDDPVEKYSFEEDKLTKILNEFLKESYKGGITFINPRYRDERIVRRGMTFDINSMYPAIYSTMRLPQARCKSMVTVTGSKDEIIAKLKDFVLRQELGFAMLKGLDCKSKSNVVIPFLKNRSDGKKKLYALNDNNNEYLPRYKADSTMLTLVELELLLETYDVFSLDRVKLFIHDEDTRLMERFKKHCDYFYDKKSHATDLGERFMSKMMLNAAYGKVAQYKRGLDYKTYSYNAETDEVIEDSYKKPSGYDSANIAAGAYITAYGRVQLTRWANAIGKEHFAYCDTDSLHVFVGLDYEKILPLDETKIGCLKKETDFQCGQWLAPKTYAEQQLDGHWLVHTAGNGLPIEMNVFYSGATIQTQRSKTVRGGRLIYKTDFELNAKGVKTVKDKDEKIARRLDEAKARWKMRQERLG